MKGGEYTFDFDAGAYAAGSFLTEKQGYEKLAKDFELDDGAKTLTASVLAVGAAIMTMF